MRKKISATLLSMAVLALILAGITACGDKKTVSGDLTPVTLNEVAHSIFYAPQYVAIEEGYFAEEGIDLQLVTGFGVRQLVKDLLFSQL